MYNQSGDRMENNLKDMIIKESIKLNLRRYRQSNELTQAELCEVLCVDRTTYTKWESGDTLPNPVQLTKLSKFYGVSIDDLIGANDLLMVSNGNGLVDGEKYYIKLNDDERRLIIKYRMLNIQDEDKADEQIEKLIKHCENQKQKKSQ